MRKGILLVGPFSMYDPVRFEVFSQTMTKLHPDIKWASGDTFDTLNLCDMLAVYTSTANAFLVLNERELYRDDLRLCWSAADEDFVKGRFENVDIVNPDDILNLSLKLTKLKKTQKNLN